MDTQDSLAERLRAWETARDAGRLELARRIQGWLDAKGAEWSPRRLSLAAGLAENVVGRILERPTRETDTESWVKLAGYLKWDAREVVLKAAGVKPDEPEDVGVIFENVLRRAPLTDLWREHLRRQLDGLVRLSLLETSAEGSAPGPESPPIRDGNAGSDRGRSRGTVRC